MQGQQVYSNRLYWFRVGSWTGFPVSEVKGLHENTGDGGLLPGGAQESEEWIPIAAPTYSAAM